MYDKMFEYVKRIVDAMQITGRLRSKTRADRYGHSERVFHWSRRLADEYEKESGVKVDKESLEVAAIFHDVAYGIAKYPKRHSTAGAEICRKYLVECGYEAEKIDGICNLIGKHSDKEALFDPDIPIELVLLMEADLMERSGAVSIVGDIWQEAMQDSVGYVHMYEHIKKFSYEQAEGNPMRTDVAKRYWEEKRRLVHMFAEQLEMDLGLDDKEKGDA